MRLRLNRVLPMRINMAIHILTVASMTAVLAAPALAGRAGAAPSMFSVLPFGEGAVEAEQLSIQGYEFQNVRAHLSAVRGSGAWRSRWLWPECCSCWCTSWSTGKRTG